ncbi:Flp pilus assembly complex ATPase component TadA [Patescibacteria group bacterium]|nr:Flp pilus assembly complex ATPase component TadA [Patescibacteria group bacterium]
MNPLSQLLERGVITESSARQVEQHVVDTGHSYETALLETGLDASVVRTLYAEYYQVPAFAIPEAFSISQEILNYIPEESASHYRVIPIQLEGDVLTVGVNNPDDIALREVLNFISTKHNIPYKMVFMLDRDIATTLSFYENLKGDVSDALGNIENDLDAEIAAGAEETVQETKKALEHIEEDAPVTKIVATILRYAVDGGASDIHIEPRDQKVLVRFRVDGSLAASLELPKAVHMAVVARVKILSSMRLDERRRPQDGRFSATFDNRKIDFRVSLLPTSFGEKVVMRILDNTRGVAKLEDTGISPHWLTTIRKMIDEPYGIILISGPTGSGKSTTLYALLSEMDRLSKNVLSLEDPVEYNIDGVSQSQVRPEIGYTFANGLRAALRQDPDIIMVGEIRDKETAQLAIQAALTGHLVLSTIHTNNAIGVIPRLIDMGVDPYLIAPTLKLAIAQRLAKRVYNDTGREEPVSKSMKIVMDESFKTLPTKYHNRIPEARTVVHPEPSPQSTTGLKGRVAIMEVLEINDDIQELILKNASEGQIFNVARSQGFMTMKEDAIIKALEHVIPYQEMNAFGSKAGNESILEDVVLAVDNQPPPEGAEAILTSDEDPSG